MRTLLVLLVALVAGVVYGQTVTPPPGGGGGGAGTVTSIATGCGLAGGPITTSGTLSGTGPCWAAGGGAAQVQTATFSPAVVLADGLEVCWKPTAANTGAAPTFAPNGLTAHPIVKAAGGALAANDIITTAQACAIYNTTGTQWELQNPQTGSGATSSAVSNVTPVTVNGNVTSAQILQQLTIPAGLMNVAASPYTYNGSGIYTAAALQTPTLTWTLNACTVSGCGSGVVRALAVIVTPAVVTATNNSWKLQAVISNTATGASGTLIAHGSIATVLTIGNLATVSNDTTTASTSAIDLTGVIYLQLTITTSTGNAGNTITEDHSSLEPASAVGATGPQGSLGNSPIYTTSQTMVAGDQFNALTFNGTGLSYTILATPPNANFWVQVCNASLTQTLTVNAVANSASIYGQGSPANFTIPIAATAGLSQCIRLASDATGAQWVGGQVGSQGPTGATGSTGPSATVVSGTSALGTSAISSAACATAVTTTATGALTTDNMSADFSADPTSTTGYSASAAGMLTIIKYLTAGFVNFKVCNNTAGSITPGAVTLQWRVIR